MCECQTIFLLTVHLRDASHRRAVLVQTALAPFDARRTQKHCPTHRARVFPARGTAIFLCNPSYLPNHKHLIPISLWPAVPTSSAFSEVFNKVLGTVQSPSLLRKREAINADWMLFINPVINTNHSIWAFCKPESLQPGWVKEFGERAGVRGCVQRTGKRGIFGEGYFYLLSAPDFYSQFAEHEHLTICTEKGGHGDCKTNRLITS